MIAERRKVTRTIRCSNCGKEIGELKIVNNSFQINSKEVLITRNLFGFKQYLCSPDCKMDWEAS